MSIQQDLKFPFGALGSQAISSIGHQAIPSKGHIDYFTVLKNKHLSYTADHCRKENWQQELANRESMHI